MQNKTFSVHESLMYAWNTFKQHRTLFLQIIITLFLLQVVNVLVSEGLKNVLPFLYAVLSVFLTVVGIILSIGIYDIFLKIYKGEEVSYLQIFARRDLFFKYLVGAILYGLIIFVVLIVAFVLGSFAGFFEISQLASIKNIIFLGVIIFAVCIFSSLLFCFWGWSLVDHNISAWASLKRSVQITKGSRLNLLCFFGAIFLLNVLGFLALVVGLVVTIPMTYAAMSFVYKKLDEKRPLKNDSSTEGHAATPEPLVPKDSIE